jgi:arabinan endo-1,5-alpha-L-arabinosidase
MRHLAADRSPAVLQTSRREFLARVAATLCVGAATRCSLDAARLHQAPTTSGRRTLTYTNPVYAGSMPDPFLMRHEDAYFAFSTTGAERKADGRIFTVLRSPDLVSWQAIGGALTPPSPDPAYEYWAPEVALENGTFFLYYAMGGKEEERFVLRVATSTMPQGPYLDTGSVLADCDRNRFTIDAHPFKDSDGQWYMFYARNFPEPEEGVFPGTAVVVDRLIGMTRLAGNCRTVVRARYPWTVYETKRRMNVYNRTYDEWHTLEGPFVRIHGGRYYCFYSGSNYQTPHYGVDVVVADHVMGPYQGQGREARVLKGIPGKVRGPGHHSIVGGPDGETDYIVYHAWDGALKVRQLCIDRLEWTPDGPRCAGPTYTPQSISVRS